MTVEAPFYTPVTYLDLQGPLNYSTQYPPFGEVVPWTLGQLEIATISNIPFETPSNSSFLTENIFDVNIYSALADDAMLYHFMGTPPFPRIRLSVMLPIKVALRPPQPAPLHLLK